MLQRAVVLIVSVLALSTAVHCDGDHSQRDGELFTAALSGWEDAEPHANDLAEFVLSRRKISAITPPAKVATGKLDSRVEGNIEWRMATPLHAACASGDARTVRFVLDVASMGKKGWAKARGKKIDVGLGSSSGKSRGRAGKKRVAELLADRFDIKGPLMLTSATVFHALALSERSSEGIAVVREALGRNEARELINVAAGEGFDPLTVASDLGHDQVASELMDAGAAIDPEERRLRGLSSFPFHPIHVAAKNGHVGIVARMLGRGVGINTRAHKGRGDTVLHGAAQSGHEDLVEALLDLGADVTIKAADGRTAIDLAHEAGHTGIVDLLREHGAPDPRPDPHALSPQEHAKLRRQFGGEVPGADGNPHMVINPPEFKIANEEEAKLEL